MRVKVIILVLFGTALTNYQPYPFSGRCEDLISVRYNSGSSKGPILRFSSLRFLKNISALIRGANIKKENVSSN